MWGPQHCCCGQLLTLGLSFLESFDSEILLDILSLLSSYPNFKSSSIYSNKNWFHTNLEGQTEIWRGRLKFRTEVSWLPFQEIQLTTTGGLVTKSGPRLETPQTVALQAPLSVGFSRQEWWSALLFLSPGDLPDPGTELKKIKSGLLRCRWPPALQADSLPTEPPEKATVKQQQLRQVKGFNNPPTRWLPKNEPYALTTGREGERRHYRGNLLSIQSLKALFLAQKTHKKLRNGKQVRRLNCLP